MTAADTAESTRRNIILTADNLDASSYLLDEIAVGRLARPQLVYMDPPFYTKRNYTVKTPPGFPQPDGCFVSGEAPGARAFSDATGGQPFGSYLEGLAARIRAARDLLDISGSLWIHLDHHAVHYAKVIADGIFGGPDYLMNEVIWQYKSGGSTKKRFARKHDTLLFYAKDPKRHKFFPLTEKSYNRNLKPYRFKGVKEYRDEGGWYTVVNMKDVWPIDMVGRTSRERTGYATQKPVALLSRIIESCTEKGDLCVDLYGGSGSMAAAAEALKRQWVSIDENPLATEVTKKRLAARGAAFTVEER